LIVFQANDSSAFDHWPILAGHGNLEQKSDYKIKQLLNGVPSGFWLQSVVVELKFGCEREEWPCSLFSFATTNSEMEQETEIDSLRKGILLDVLGKLNQSTNSK
jgi:hypothetical protein